MRIIAGIHRGRTLHAPKGLAMSAGRLYVTDIDTLVEIDPASGRITGSWRGAEAKFMNDAAAARQSNPRIR